MSKLESLAPALRAVEAVLDRAFGDWASVDEFAFTTVDGKRIRLPSSAVGLVFETFKQHLHDGKTLEQIVERL